MTTNPRTAVLVVDDEARILELVTRALEGRPLATASSLAQARDKLANAAVVLLDLKLGEDHGFELLQEVKEHHPGVPVIIMTAFASIENAVDAMKRGASDYITKPFASLDELRLIVDRALMETRLHEENARLREMLAEQDRFEEMIGASAPMKRLYAAIARVAESDATVLITGESGTGKELVARAVHRRSGRSRRPFMEINCAAIPETLLESELFGHERGAFTGAHKMKKGLFESAPGGTVFLDEIGEMPTTVQVKLLRVIEDKSFIRLGGVAPTRVDVRILAATNRDLAEAVAANRFREDLYYRLAVLHLEVPPLRDREGDVERIIGALLPGMTIESDVMDMLCSYGWPGNIRELKNVVERVKGMGGKRVTLADVPSTITRPARALASGSSLPELVDEFERRLITEALKETGGSRTAAAQKLGVSRQALQYKLEKHGINY
mgnify:CR=1 FL=1